MKNKRKLVQVYEAANEMEAQVIKGLLESNGIPCLLKSNVMPSPFGPTMNEVKVMVWDSEAEKAKELIASDSDV